MLKRALFPFLSVCCVSGSMTNAYMLFYERCIPSTPIEQRSSSSTDSPPAAYSVLAPTSSSSSQQPSTDSHMSDPPSSSAPSSPLSPPTAPQRAQSGQMAESLVNHAAAIHASATSALQANMGQSGAPGRWNGKYATGAANSTLRIDTKPMSSSAHSSPLHTPSSSGSSTRSSASASRPPRSLQLWLGSIPSLPPPSSLPGWLVRSIWQDNVDFVRDKQLFDFSCQSFLFHVCSRMAAATQQQRQQRMADSTQQAQIATFYVFKVRKKYSAVTAEGGALSRTTAMRASYDEHSTLCALLSPILILPACAVHLCVCLVARRCCVGRPRMAPSISGWNFYGR